jgi:hypothetical protein
VYLNVVTEGQVYVLRASPPTQFNIKAAQGLAAAGEGVLKQVAARSDKAAKAPVAPVNAPVSTSGSGSGSLSNRLEELAKLRDSGMLTDAEFNELRSKALKEL